MKIETKVAEHQLVNDWNIQFRQIQSELVHDELAYILVKTSSNFKSFLIEVALVRLLEFDFGIKKIKGIQKFCKHTGTIEEVLFDVGFCGDINERKDN